MRRFLATAVLIGFASSASAADLKEEIRQAILKTITTEQPVENSGVSIAVFNSHEILFEGGFGWKDRERQLPASASTLYAIDGYG